MNGCECVKIRLTRNKSTKFVNAGEFQLRIECHNFYALTYGKLNLHNLIPVAKKCAELSIVF